MYSLFGVLQHPLHYMYFLKTRTPFRPPLPFSNKKHDDFEYLQKLKVLVFDNNKVSILLASAKTNLQTANSWDYKQTATVYSYSDFFLVLLREMHIEHDRQSRFHILFQLSQLVGRFIDNLLFEEGGMERDRAIRD